MNVSFTLDINSTAGALPNFQPENLNALKRKTISVAQANLRLGHLEETEPLTPRREKEREKLYELVDMTDGRLIDNPVFRVQWATGQFYNVQLLDNSQKSGSDLLLIDTKERFKNCNHQLSIMTTAMVRADSSRSILVNLVRPKPEMEWYKSGTLAQVQEILKSDFTDALCHTYLADLNLLLTARTLHKNAEIFQNILNLHSTCTELYEDNLVANRNLEITLLTQAEETRRFAIELRDLILINGGSQFNNYSEDFERQANAIITAQKKQSLGLYTSIEQTYDAFLKKIDSLNKEIGESSTKITGKQGTFLDMMNKYNFIMSDKDAIEKELNQLAEKFQKWEEAKHKEDQSRKTETYTEDEVYTTNVPRQVSRTVSEPTTTSYFWGLFSSTGTTTRTTYQTEWVSEKRTIQVQKTKMTQEDHGSATLREEYRQLKAKFDQNDAKLQAQKIELKELIRKNSPGYTENELEQAAQSLAAALTALQMLKTAIQKKQNQIKQQIISINHSLGKRDQNTKLIGSFLNSINELQDLQNHILSAHAIWIQSHRQCSAIQSIQFQKSIYLTSVIRDLQENSNEGCKTIEAEIAHIQNIALSSPENPIVKKFPSYQQLIDAYED